MSQVTLETLATQLSAFSAATLRNQSAHSLSLDRMRQTQDLTVREMRSLTLRLGAVESDVGGLKARLADLEGPQGPLPGVPRGTLPPLADFAEESPSGLHYLVTKEKGAKYEKLREDANKWRAIRKASWKIAVYVAGAFALALAALGAMAVRDAAERHPGLGIPTGEK